MCVCLELISVNMLCYLYLLDGFVFHVTVSHLHIYVKLKRLKENYEPELILIWS